MLKLLFAAGQALVLLVFLPVTLLAWLAVALEHHRLVARDMQGRFVLGPRLSELSAAAGEDRLLAAAGPVLRPAGPFPVERQRALGLAVMKTLGFDFDHGTLILREASKKKRASLHLVRGAENLARDDEALVAMAREELSEILGIEDAPELTRVFRFQQTSIQPNVGHLARMRALADAAEAHEGIHVAFAGFDGSGIPDTIRRGRAVGARIAEERRR